MVNLPANIPPYNQYKNGRDTLDEKIKRDKKLFDQIPYDIRYNVLMAYTQNVDFQRELYIGVHTPQFWFGFEFLERMVNYYNPMYMTADKFKQELSRIEEEARAAGDNKFADRVLVDK